MRCGKSLQKRYIPRVGRSKIQPVYLSPHLGLDQVVLFWCGNNLKMKPKEPSGLFVWIPHQKNSI